jgi:DNA-binding transcriptional LysR family regulator
VYHGLVFQSIFSQNGANVRFNAPNAVALSFGNPFPNQVNISDPTGGFVFTPGTFPNVRVQLTVSDTQTVVEQVAERTLELGIVGAGRRHRGVVFEPFFRDEVVLACPPSHTLAGKTITLDQLKSEPLIVMQEGAGVRQVIEDELRKAGARLRDLDVRLELGLQESVRSAVLAGHGVTFISRLAIESDLAAGTIATARVRGLDPVREIFLARASGRSETRAARAFLEYAREHLPS